MKLEAGKEMDRKCVFDWLNKVYITPSLSYSEYTDEEIRIFAHDALVLLKEQEPVKPHYNARTNWYECGACHYSMTSGMHCRGELIPAYKVGYCAKCGRAVMWNEI